MDDLENPYADDAVAGADAPQDPVQAAKDDAWLAQFRADNAAAVMEHNFAASSEAMAEAKGAEATREYDLKKESGATHVAQTARASAADYEQKAEHDAARHDEYELKAQLNTHDAVEAESLATKFHADAMKADGVAKADRQESAELYKVYEQNTTEYEIMQEQAVAAQRIATDEARLPHPRDAPPADPAGEPHQP